MHVQQDHFSDVIGRYVNFTLQVQVFDLAVILHWDGFFRGFPLFYQELVAKNRVRHRVNSLKTSSSHSN